MFLKKLELTDIRCFAQAEVDFDEEGGDNRKWTVLVGENGTGTSTVLKSIALCLAGSDALPELVGNPDSWIRYDTDEARIRLLIEASGGEERTIALNFRRGESLASFIDRSKESLAPLNDALAHTSRNYPTFAYGAARNQNADSAELQLAADTSHPRTRSLRSLLTQKRDLVPIENWAIQLEQRDSKVGLETVRQVLSDFLPETSFDHIDKIENQLVFRTPDGRVPLSQLSKGYRKVAAWVGDLLFQITSIFDDYNNPLDVRGVLIIEEVDLHLHPKWQRQLLRFLTDRLPKLQVVVTTHSLVTAQQAPENALHYTVRRDTHPVVEQFNGDPGKFLLHQLIATEAFGQMSDESLEVEHLKEEYRALHRKGQRSATEIMRMREIENRLAGRPVDDRAAPVFTLEQNELLQKILQNNSRQTT